MTQSSMTNRENDHCEQARLDSPSAVSRDQSTRRTTMSHGVAVRDDRLRWGLLGLFACVGLLKGTSRLVLALDREPTNATLAAASMEAVAELALFSGIGLALVTTLHRLGSWVTRIDSAPFATTLNEPKTLVPSLGSSSNEPEISDKTIVDHSKNSRRTEAAGLADQARRAIREGEWAEAIDLIEAAQEEDATDPSVIRLVEHWEKSKSIAIDRLTRELSAAREAIDPARVLILRDELAFLNEETIQLEIDRELASWIMGLMQRRLQSGGFDASVAEIAGAAARSFGHTREGAALKASLPTLLRSAELLKAKVENERPSG